MEMIFLNTKNPKVIVILRQKPKKQTKHRAIYIFFVLCMALNRRAFKIHPFV